MKVIYSKEDFNDVFSVVEYPEEYIGQNGSHLVEKTTRYDSSLDGGHITRLFLDGVHIAFINKSRREDVSYYVRTDAPYLQMHFELHGSAFYTAKDYAGMDCPIPFGHHTLFYFPALYGYLVYPAIPMGFSVEIEITLKYLNRVFDQDLSELGNFARDIYHERPTQLGNKSFPITAKMREVLLEMYHCPFVGQLKKIFIEGKLLELLSLQIAQLNKEGNTSETERLRSDDLERIMEAKKIVAENIEQPYSIEELSKIIGMNRTKLQKTFKEIHGKTIFHTLADLRMEMAQELLQTEKDMKIAEIAKRVGYKNPNHFSSAYKRRFGHIPRLLREIP